MPSTYHDSTTYNNSVTHDNSASDNHSRANDDTGPSPSSREYYSENRRTWRSWVKGSKGG